MSKIIGQSKLQAKLDGQPIPHFLYCGVIEELESI